jgi:hypothetical protein
MPSRQRRAVARRVGYIVESEKALHGAGDVGEFGAVEVDYGEGTDSCDPGRYLAVVRDIDEDKLIAEYLYDDGTSESVSLQRDSKETWQDYNNDAPVMMDFQPSQEKIETLKGRVDASSR